MSNKQIFQFTLQDDFGELWMDDNHNPLALIDANDGAFRSEYYKFVIEHFGGELISNSIQITDKEAKKLSGKEGSALAYYDVLKSKIDKVIEKAASKEKFF